VNFDFFPLRFEFVARESLFFPPGKAANTLRGALGVMFRRIACVPQCVRAETCEIRSSCPYAKIFEPTMTHHGTGEGPSPSGLSDWPRPFVFRARHLDGRTVDAGERFWFDLHVFSLDGAAIAYFIQTFDALGEEGLGPGRGRADLVRVCTIPLAGMPSQPVYERSQQMITAKLVPASIDLGPRCSPPRRIRVDFLSPTELKHHHKIARRPDFPIHFGRLRDRISTLRSLYGCGPLEIGFEESNTRAATVQMIRCDIRREESERRSTRTGHSHSIGGFVGSAEYEGDFAEFLPYLEIGRWTGVGRQVVWGKGEIAVRPV